VFEDRAFVSRGDVVEAYKLTDEDGKQTFEHIANLPSLKNKNDEKIAPSKIFTQEQDSKMIMNQGSQVFYYDIEKGVVVQEMNAEKNRIIEDICPFQKTMYNTPKQEFFGVTQQNIVHFDPRLENGIAEDRSYKTNYQFNSIMSATDGNVSVGSSTGDIRMIQNIGDRNAKNL